MRIIDWNISYAGDTAKKVEYLQTLIQDDVCIMLQEVKPHAYEYIKEALGEDFNFFYSLEYRRPSRFDSDARRLGVLIAVSKGISVETSGVIERSPFPDRTMYVVLNVNGNPLKLLALHSLTGCGYYRSKSVQYDSFAEFIDDYRPDLIGIDANEPQIDHYDMKKMEFFDNGPGAKHFFDEMIDIGLTDTYVRYNNIDSIEEGVPLAETHTIRRKGAVRYDFLFSKNNIGIERMDYLYEEAINAGSDHALVLCDINL